MLLQGSTAAVCWGVVEAELYYLQIKNHLINLPTILRNNVSTVGDGWRRIRCVSYYPRS